MATKIEIRCTQAFKDSIKAYAERKDVTVTSYIKAAITEKMLRDEKKRG